MHCCLAVRAAAKAPVHFMAQLAFRLKKMDMFGAMSQIVIYVPDVRDQPLHCLMG